MFKKSLLFLVILLVGVFFFGFGSALSDVDNDGYLEIHDCYELQSMNNNLSANYELANDIDCSMTREWNYGGEYCAFVQSGPKVYGSFGSFMGEYFQDSKDLCEQTGCFGWYNNAPIPSYKNVSTCYLSYYRYWKDKFFWSDYFLGFIPVGNDSAIFTGNFNGNYHTIYDLAIHKVNYEDDVGLFGRIDGGQVKNVFLANINIRGPGSSVGALVGDIRGGIISCSSSSGSISGSDINFFGGKYDYYEGYVGGGVFEDGGSDTTGGLIGVMGSGLVINSFSTADVVGNSRIGGLVGLLSGGNVIESYSKGNVTGGSLHNAGYSIGGLIGRAVNYEDPNYNIENSFFWGKVSGLNNSLSVGGLVGSTDSVIIFNSYSMGKVIGTLINYTGGLVGSSNLLTSGSYFDNQTSGQVNHCRYNGFCGIGVSSDYLKHMSWSSWNSSIWNYSTSDPHEWCDQFPYEGCYQEGYYPTLYMRECTPVEVKYNITFNPKDNERVNNANIICSTEIRNLPSGNGRVNFSLYAMNGTNKTLISSSGFIDMESSEENGYYSVFKNYTFDDAIRIKSPVMKCSAEFEDLGVDNIGGYYDSDYIKDIDGDGYMSFWQANSIGKCSDFNVDVEGEDDWPYDDFERNSDCPAKSGSVPNCEMYPAEGEPNYWNCAYCLNKKQVCSDIENQSFIEKCESDNSEYWLRGVGWEGVLYNYLYETPNTLSNLSCDNFVQFESFNEGGVFHNTNEIVNNVEYLTYDGFVNVIRNIEVEANNPSSKDLANSIFLLYMSGDQIQYYESAAFPFVSYLNPLKSYQLNLAFKYVLRHPEFYAADVARNHKQSLILNPYTGDIFHYRWDKSPYQIKSPSLDSNDCLIKKVYLDGELISMSHAMELASCTMTTPVLYPAQLVYDHVLNIEEKDRVNNFNGDIFGILLKKYIMPYWVAPTLVPNLYYTPRLSDALEKAKSDFSLTVIRKTLSATNVKKYCSLMNEYHPETCLP